jgi:hypothetical protein
MNIGIKEDKKSLKNDKHPAPSVVQGFATDFTAHNKR